MALATDIKLDSIVRGFIVQTGATTVHKYSFYLHLAIQVLRELNMDVSGDIVTVMLPINDNNTVDLPADYIKYSRIGLVGADGNIYDFGLDSNLMLPRSHDACGNLEFFRRHTENNAVADPTLGPSGYGGGWWGGWNEGGNYRNGECIGKFYGLGGGNNNNGYYRIDKQNGLIAFSSNMRSNNREIVLEYLSSMKEIDGEYLVNPFIAEAVRTGTYYASIEFDNRVGAGEKERARQQYERKRRLALARKASFTANEALMTIRKSLKLSIKN